MTRSPIPIAAALAVLLPAATAAQPRTNADAERALAEYRAGWASMHAEAFDEALAAFDHALTLDPTLNLAHYGKGRAYLALSRYREAIASLATCRDNYVAHAGRKFAGQNDAIRYREDRLLELRELQRQYQTGRQTEQTRDTLRLIQNAIRDTQNANSRAMNVSIDTYVPAFVSLSLGSAYFRAEQMDQAEREYKAAVSTDSKLGEAHNNLAVIYFMQGKASLASDHIRAAEKAGFRVNPDLKDQVKEAMGK